MKDLAIQYEGLLWKVTGVAAIVAAVLLLVLVIGAESAIQEASGAAIAVAVAVIPYVLARAAGEIVNSPDVGKRKEAER